MATARRRPEPQWLRARPLDAAVAGLRSFALAPDLDMAMVMASSKSRRLESFAPSRGRTGAVICGCASNAGRGAGAVAAGPTVPPGGEALRHC